MTSTDDDLPVRPLRIKVRGQFRDLTPEQRADLLARSAEHDPLTSAHTPEGTLTYDVAARPFFTWRSADTARTDADVTAAAARAEARAQAWLQERGLTGTLSPAQVEDLSQAPLAGRQRRARAQG